MVYKIIWSPKALQTFLANTEYLSKEWSKKELDTFIAATNNKLQLLSAQPAIGVLSVKQKNIRKTLIGKRILLIYRFQSSKKQIELLQFFNTWQHPDKMR